LPLHEGDIEERDDDIYIRSKVLSSAMGFDARVNPQSLRLVIRTQEPWPLQKKMDRLSRNAKKSKKPEAELPLQDDGYSMASAPRVDVTAQQRLVRDAGKDFQKSTDYTATVRGDILQHAAKAVVSGNQDDKIETAYVNFSKQADDPVLLGPLKARFYELNDVTSVTVPFSASGGTQRGIHVSNKIPGVSLDTYTEVEGDAPPGWDVELYRGNNYLGGATAGDDGRYRFDNIPLFSGVNTFTVKMYGLQGEERSENKTVSVAAQGEENGLYNASITQQNSNTYSATPSTDIDKGSLRFAGLYEVPVSRDTTYRTGLTALEQGGNKNLYLYNGFARVFDSGYIVNADSVVTDAKTYMTALSARRNIDKYNFSGTVRYQGRDFTTSPSATSVDVPSTIAANFLSAGPLLPALFKDTTFETLSAYSQQGGGSRTTENSLQVASRWNSLLFNNKISYETAQASATSAGQSLLQGSSSIRGRAAGASWRNTLTYTISPDVSPDRYNFNVSKLLTRNVRGEFDFLHEFDSAHSVGNLSLNYNGEAATITPSVSYDSEKVLEAMVRVSFGMAYDRSSNDLVMRAGGIGLRGGVSAFVFLDKDGNGEFDGQDEPIEDAVVEAVQVRQVGYTDSSGVAFLPGLPANKRTDIVVQQGSTFDLNWVPGRKGVSVQPHASSLSRLNFPIVRGGEIEGMVYVRLSSGDTRPPSALRLRLYDGDGKVALSTQVASDGYYLFERVPPGRYYLLPDADDVAANRVAQRKPQVVDIGFDGTALRGNNLYLAKDSVAVSFAIAPDISDEQAANPRAKINDLKENAVVLNLGSYHSRLLSSLVWYKMNMFDREDLGGVSLLTDPAETNASLKTGKSTLRVLLPSTSVDDGYSRCARIKQKGYSCAVEVWPNGSKKG
jgi:hypothetical protein